MRRYLAVIMDAYREAVDSKFLLFLLVASTFVIGLAFGVGWWNTREFSFILGEINGRPRLGLTAKDESDGLRITAVDPAGPAASQQVFSGAYLEAIGEVEVSTRKELAAALKGFEPAQEVTIRVVEPTVNFLGWGFDPNGKFYRNFAQISTEQKIATLQIIVANYIIGLFGVIAGLVVTAAFMPRFLNAGNTHLVMARPVSRLWVIWARYLGGLSFMVILSTYVIGGLFLALSLRSGVWDFSTLWAIPILVLIFAQLYAFSCLVAVLSRNTVVTIVASVLFYFAAMLFNWIHNLIEATTLENQVTNIALSEDGRRVSVVRRGERNPFDTGRQTIEQYQVSTSRFIGNYTDGISKAPFEFRTVKGSPNLFTLVYPPAKLVELDQMSRRLVWSSALPSVPPQRFALDPQRKEIVIKSGLDFAVYSLEENGERLAWPRFEVTGVEPERAEQITALAHGGFLVAAGYGRGRIELRSANDGSVLRRWEHHKEALARLFFHDEKLVAIGEDGHVSLINTKEEKPLAELRGLGEVKAVAVDVDSGRFALGIDAAPRLFGIKDKRITPEERISSGVDRVTSLAFSRSGQHLAVGGIQGRVTIHDLKQGERLGALDLSKEWRTPQLITDGLYWLFPRTRELDRMTQDLLDTDAGREFSREASALEVRYSKPILGGVLFILVSVGLGAFVFVRRDL